jgi:hypothetical protein
VALLVLSPAASPAAAGHGERRPGGPADRRTAADDLLHVDERAIGAEPEGTAPSGVEWRSAHVADELAAVVLLRDFLEIL